MKKSSWAILLFIFLLGLGAGFLISRSRSNNSSANVTMHESKTMYNCAMHPQYISDKPGNCPICGMKLTPMNKNMEHAASEGGEHSMVSEKKIAYYRDPMHPWITSDKPGKSPDCGMDMVPIYTDDENAKGIRIDPTTVQNMGVRTELISKRDLQTEIRTSGKIKVDESRVTLVNARVMGYADKLRANITGQKVMKNQTLLELYSPDLVTTEEEYLQALRYAKNSESGSVNSSLDLVESSKRRLINWGITENEIQALEKRGHVNKTIAISSPLSGVVLEKMVVEGQSIMPGMALYKIADLSKVWVVANVYQNDLAAIKLGAQADIALSYLPGKNFSGRVTFISPVLDEQSKTVEIRLEIANTPALDLKPEMFATVHIHSPALKNIVAIPEQAIIHSGKRNIAVIALGGGYFEPRPVKLGINSGDYVQILEGVHEGEKLVVSSQFLIDSESNLKAAIQQMQSTATEDSMPSMGSSMNDSSAESMHSSMMPKK